MVKNPFKPDSPAGRLLFDFWRSLDEDRQSRAQLRRADGLTQIVLVPAFHRLLNQLRAVISEGKRDDGWLHSDSGRLRLAAIAGALAQVKRHEPLQEPYRSTTAAFMAKRKKGTESPRVSELRFRRLLQANDMQELYPMLRRTFALMDGVVDVHVLAKDLWFWGDRLRRQWAYDYYAVLGPKLTTS